jgi:hypothetical protein
MRNTVGDISTLLGDMLHDIEDFHGSSSSPRDTTSSLYSPSEPLKKEGAEAGEAAAAADAQTSHGGKRKRETILGEGVELSDLAWGGHPDDAVIKSARAQSIIESAMKKHFLFSHLFEHEMQDAIDSMHCKFFSADEVIIADGDVGDTFYIVDEGHCEVSVRGQPAQVAACGAYFGDLSLMYRSLRAATVRALTDCTVW